MPLISIRNRFSRILRTTLIGVTVFVDLAALLILVVELNDRLPVHPVSAHCFQSRIYFEGPKSKRFNTFYINMIKKWQQPYSIRNGIIYTTGYGSGDDNMNKFIQNNIRPEWFSDDPHFETPEQKKIVETWRKISEQENLKESLIKEWCHVVEAAVAKDGIDIEVRRQHPDIWPPDKWPVPPQPK